jgi:hypothetical protein
MKTGIRITHWIIVLAAIGCLNPLVSRGAETKREPALRLTFVGVNTLARDTNAAKITKAFSLPASADFKKNAFDTLTRLALETAGFPVAGAVNDDLRPLAEDIVAWPVSAEWHGGDGKPWELFLALQMPAERAAEWSNRLSRAVIDAKLGAIKMAEEAGARGWKSAGGAASVAFLQSGEWTLFQATRGNLSSAAPFLSRLKDQKSGTNWLEAEIDWARLSTTFPFDQLAFKAPITRMAVSGRNDNLKITGDITYREAIPFKAEDWKLPRGLMEDPLVSFTAIRGAAPFFSQTRFFRDLDFNPLDRQIFFWAQSGVPFQAQVAIPAPDAEKALARLKETAPQRWNSVLEKKTAGRFAPATNSTHLNWLGLPVITPSLYATNIAEGSYLAGRLFPPPPRRNRGLPEPLLNQISGRKNLVYYDWEITQERVGLWQVLENLVPIFAPPGVGSPETRMGRRPGQRWLKEVAPLLGNTVTEISQDSPTRFSFVRKSNLGLTGMELVFVTRALSGPEPALAPLISRPAPKK